MEVRLLAQADYEVFDAFLAGHAETSMFLRSNARRAGLDYAGRTYQFRGFGAFEAGALAGVLGLFYNGNLMSQAPDPPVLEALFDTAQKTHPDFVVQGVLGAADQAAWLLDRLGPAPEAIRLSEREPLLRLELAALRVPEALAGSGLTWRRGEARDLQRMVVWRTAYNMEMLGALPPEMAADAHAAVGRWLDREPPFLLLADGAPVAMAAYNAALPDIVQIGGVYTPPEFRRRGYGRSAVAAALIEARDAGVTSAILFTHSPAAERAYRALGFERIGDHHIALLDPGLKLGEAQRVWI